MWHPIAENYYIYNVQGNLVGICWYYTPYCTEGFRRYGLHMKSMYKSGVLSPFESTDFCSFSTRPMPTRCWSSVRPSLRWLAEQTKRQWSSVLRYWSTWTRCIWLAMKLGTWNLGIKQHSQLVIDHYAMDWWFIPLNFSHPSSARALP